MAPKTFYDAGEVQKKVTEAAEKVFETLKEEGWECKCELHIRNGMARKTMGIFMHFETWTQSAMLTASSARGSRR